jgi:hypothetical protein
MNQRLVQLRLTHHIIYRLKLSIVVIGGAIFLAGVLMGIYAAATSLVTAMTSNFNFTETTRHQNVLMFDAAIMQAIHIQQTASAKCADSELINKINQRRCYEKSIAAQREANRAASDHFKRKPSLNAQNKSI